MTCSDLVLDFSSASSRTPSCLPVPACMARYHARTSVTGSKACADLGGSSGEFVPLASAAIISRNLDGHGGSGTFSFSMMGFSVCTRNVYDPSTQHLLLLPSAVLCCLCSCFSIWKLGDSGKATFGLRDLGISRAGSLEAISSTSPGWPCAIGSHVR